MCPLQGIECSQVDIAIRIPSHITSATGFANAARNVIGDWHFQAKHVPRMLSKLRAKGEGLVGGVRECKHEVALGTFVGELLEMMSNGAMKSQRQVQRSLTYRTVQRSLSIFTKPPT